MENFEKIFKKSIESKLKPQEEEGRETGEHLERETETEIEHEAPIDEPKSVEEKEESASTLPDIDESGEVSVESDTAPTQEIKDNSYWREKQREREEAHARRSELRAEKDKYYSKQQQKVWKWEDFIQHYRSGDMHKTATIRPGRVSWAFWRKPVQQYLDVLPPVGAEREGSLPLVIIGGLGSGMESYLDSIYEAVTAGRRVIFMNPSRNFRPRPQDVLRIDELHNSTAGKGNIPKPLLRKASVAVRILEEMGFERFDLLGHSQGGIVAAAITALERDRVRVLDLVSTGGMIGDDSFLPLAIRFGHEIAHRSLSGKIPWLYRPLESFLFKTGIMNWLYRKYLLPELEEDARKEMLSVLEAEHKTKPTEHEFGKKMQKTQKVHGIGNMLHWPGTARAGAAIAKARIGRILEYQQNQEELQTRIYVNVAHGEIMFPAHMQIKRIQELGADFSVYSTDNPMDEHNLESIAMRNTLEILELEDKKDAENILDNKY